MGLDHAGVVDRSDVDCMWAVLGPLKEISRWHWSNGLPRMCTSDAQVREVRVHERPPTPSRSTKATWRRVSSRAGKLACDSSPLQPCRGGTDAFHVPGGNSISWHRRSPNEKRIGQEVVLITCHETAVKPSVASAAQKVIHAAWPPRVCNPAGRESARARRAAPSRSRPDRGAAPVARPTPAPPNERRPGAACPGRPCRTSTKPSH